MWGGHDVIEFLAGDFDGTLQSGEEDADGDGGVGFVFADDFLDVSGGLFAFGVVFRHGAEGEVDAACSEFMEIDVIEKHRAGSAAVAAEEAVEKHAGLFPGLELEAEFLPIPRAADGIADFPRPTYNSNAQFP